MAKTIVKFKLPMVIVDEGTYDVKLYNKTARITIKLVQNNPNLQNITGFTAHSSGSGTVKIIPDHHGVANFSDISVEIPYDKIENIPLEILQTALDYINRMIEVVRYGTNAFWLTKVTGRDVYSFSHENFDDNEKRVLEHMTFLPSSRGFAIDVMEQSMRMNIINEVLINGTQLPYDGNTYFDAIDHFVKGDFNESVVLINIVLEVFTSRYLFDYLTLVKGIEKNESSKTISRYFSDGMHKVMKKAFMDIQSRTIENTDLWSKFEDVRDKRKQALHPYIRKIGEQEARATIDKVIQLISWMQKMPQKPTTN